MFKEVAESFEGQFAAGSKWSANGIKAFPSNFKSTEPMPKEYVVLELLPGQHLDIQFAADEQVGGMFIVQIYTAVNEGIRRAFEIGDMLKDIFHQAVLPNNISTGSCVLDVKGNDPADPSLFRADFTVTFKAFR